MNECCHFNRHISSVKEWRHPSQAPECSFRHDADTLRYQQTFSANVWGGLFNGTNSRVSTGWQLHSFFITWYGTVEYSSTRLSMLHFPLQTVSPHWGQDQLFIIAVCVKQTRHKPLLCVCVCLSHYTVLAGAFIRSNLQERGAEYFSAHSRLINTLMYSVVMHNYPWFTL